MLRHIKNISFFDVTLRDGLQSIKKEYSLLEKKNILYNIINLHNPNSIEIGSLVSNKVLPQMNYSKELYNYAINNNNWKHIDFYLLIPNFKMFEKNKNINFHNISLISSVSDSFQKKNIKLSLNQTKDEIVKFNNYSNVQNIKLYLSCINKCPIDGIIDNDKIIDEIYYYHNLKNITNICLSDTTGDLLFNDFKYIIDKIIKHIDPKKLSLHLHYNENDVFNTLNIIQYAIDKNINIFDVSLLENVGGCSVTIENNILKPNLNYNIFNLL